MRGVNKRWRTLAALLAGCFAAYSPCGVAYAAQTSPSQTDRQASPVPEIVSSLRSQDFDEALRLCQTALAKTPRDFRVWTLRGMAYSGKRATSPALDAFERALKLNAGYLPALEGAAQIEYQRGSASAIPLLERVLAQRPEDPTSHAMLGFLEYREKHCPDAVSHFQMSGSLLATQPSALAAYGACLATLGRYDDAAGVLRQALAAAPGSQQIRYNLALAQWKASHPEEALATLQPVTGDSAENEEFLLLAADIRESMNDTKEALVLLRKAILANPMKPDAYLDFAYLSYDHASPRVGIDILDAGLSQMPNEAQLYLVRGVLYAQMGKFAEATEDFEAANRLDPNLSFAGTAVGIVESQEHRSAEALDTFRAAAKAHPKDALTQYLLAEALSQQAKPEGSPEHAEEIAAAQLAAQLDPRMAAAHDLLAGVYLQDGHTQLAIDQSRAALAADPRDQQAVFHLILALRKTGQKDQVPGLVKQLAELRAGVQAEAQQNKRYELQEMPAASVAR